MESNTMTQPDQFSPPSIRPFLLWDVSRDQFDFKTNSKLVIERVCMLGNLSDFKEILRYYGTSTIRHDIIQSAALDYKSLYFFSQILNIPLDKFRCYTKKPFLNQP